jgi:DNA polymerase-4
MATVPNPLYGKPVGGGDPGNDDLGDLEVGDLELESAESEGLGSRSEAPASSPVPEPGPTGPHVNWLFVDLNSYFASVEQQVRPELRGKPIGIVPMMADTTCCIAASYEAKAFGVKTGTIVADAKRMCPALVLVEARHQL